MFQPSYWIEKITPEPNVLTEGEGQKKQKGGVERRAKKLRRIRTRLKNRKGQTYHEGHASQRGEPRGKKKVGPGIKEVSEAARKKELRSK